MKEIKSIRRGARSSPEAKSEAKLNPAIKRKIAKLQSVVPSQIWCHPNKLLQLACCSMNGTQKIRLVVDASAIPFVAEEITPSDSSKELPEHQLCNHSGRVC